MANRIFLNDQKIVISKPGFDADDASLADKNKVFDSDWGVSSPILKQGFSALPDWAAEPADTIHTIPFGFTLNYVPAAMVWMTILNASSYSQMVPIESGVAGGTIDFYARAFVDRIEVMKACVDWGYDGGLNPTHLFYMVFAV